jgi:hypothetical protein
MSSVLQRIPRKAKVLAIFASPSPNHQINKLTDFRHNACILTEKPAMKKKLLQPASTLVSIVKRIGRSETVPFTQKPAENQFVDPASKAKDDLSGPELFSLFTADIIKKDVTFTR